MYLAEYDARILLALVACFQIAGRHNCVRHADFYIGSNTFAVGFIRGIGIAGPNSSSRAENMKSNAIKPVSETPEEFLRRHPPAIRGKRTPEAAANFLLNPRGDVFFYPACGNDFDYPLLNFGRACRTFIFADWAGGDAAAKGIPRWPEKGDRLTDQISCTASLELSPQSIEPLGNMTSLLNRHFNDQVGGLPSSVCRYLGTGGPRPRGARYAEFADGQPEPIRFYHLCLEGVSLYENLFAARKIAPRILCIKRCGGIGGWTHFRDGQAHLAKLIKRTRRWPQYLIVDEGNHDWPYPHLVQEFVDWQHYGPKM